MPFETPKSKNEDLDTKPFIGKEQETFAKDYFSYLRKNDVEGLYELAEALRKDGRQKEAAEVLVKARQVVDVLEKASQMKRSDH